MGTARTMATAVVISVPTMKIPAPYWRAPGSHFPDQKNPMPLWAKAVLDDVTRLINNAATIATNSAAPPQRKMP